MNFYQYFDCCCLYCMFSLLLFWPSFFLYFSACVSVVFLFLHPVAIIVRELILDWHFRLRYIFDYRKVCTRVLQVFNYFFFSRSLTISSNDGRFSTFTCKHFWITCIIFDGERTISHLTLLRNINFDANLEYWKMRRVDRSKTLLHDLNNKTHTFKKLKPHLGTE